MKIKPFKMKVTSEQSRIVQQTLFSNNYMWFTGDTTITNLSSPHLYFYEDTLRQTEDFQESFFIEHELPELTFQEFFDRYVKWCIKDCEEVSAWTAKEFRAGSFIINNSYLCVENNYQNYWFYPVDDIPKDYIELTFEQFKQYVLKTKDMEKKIIGYKLKEDCKQYRVAACRIADISDDGLTIDVTRKGCSFLANTRTETYLKEAGVLDLWFEPVFEENNYKIGEYVTDDDCKNVYKYGRYENGKHYPQEEYSSFSFGTNLRRLTSEEIIKYQTKELYFGKVKFTIKKGDNFATTEYGKVTKEEIGIAINYIENPPKLNNYTFGVKMEKGTDTYTLDIIEKSKKAYIAFGCQEGTYKELKAIYNAFE